MRPHVTDAMWTTLAGILRRRAGDREHLPARAAPVLEQADPDPAGGEQVGETAVHRS